MSVVIELDGVSRVYPGPPEATVLSDCTLQVNEGDFLTVVGPSGSGKSTLLNLLGLLDKPSSGRYMLRGIDMSSLGENSRAAVRGLEIGFVFQSFQLLEHRSCLDNVMLADLYTAANEHESYRSATTALTAVGLDSKMKSLPSELSGGERQRVAIARSLVGAPSVLLCDEPTGNLDSSNAAAILDLFVALNRNGSTIVLITHDPAIAKLGNRMVSILDGRVTEVDKGSRSLDP